MTIPSLDEVLHHYTVEYTDWIDTDAFDPGYAVLYNRAVRLLARQGVDLHDEDYEQRLGAAIEKGRDEYVLEQGVQLIEELYEEALDRLADMDGHDCWRVLRLSTDRPEAIDPLGIYWSVEYQTAGAYEAATGRGSDYTYRARIDLEHVDKYWTVMVNCHPIHGDKEVEVRFLKDRPIFVYDVELDNGAVIEINDWRTT